MCRGVLDGWKSSDRTSMYPRPIVIIALGIISFTASRAQSQESAAALPDLALQPAQVVTEQGPAHVKSSILRTRLIIRSSIFNLTFKPEKYGN